MPTLQSTASRRQRGFSLIELMAVTAIFVILTAIVLANNSRFGSIVVLENLSHDIALSIREAQVYGIAVKRCDPSQTAGCNASNQYTLGYGMHFAPGVIYALFADSNTNGFLENGELVKSTTLTGNYQISRLCAPIGTCGLTSLDIVYKRPEPDACISANGATTFSGATCISSIQRASITVQSPRGDTSTILIDASGQISVQ